MTQHDDHAPASDETRPLPGVEREGDVDEDRQDPPVPEKTTGDERDLDGTTATPGDDADGDD